MIGCGVETTMASKASRSCTGLQNVMCEQNHPPRPPGAGVGHTEQPQGHVRREAVGLHLQSRTQLAVLGSSRAGRRGPATAAHSARTQLASCPASIPTTSKPCSTLSARARSGW
jgi:hypothetical protein